jgi:hypothetical protein
MIWPNKARKLLLKTSRSLICHEHFSGKCYCKNIRAEFQGGRLRYDLIPVSLPTLFQVCITNNTILIRDEN